MLNVQLAMRMRLGALAILFLFLLQPVHDAAGTRARSRLSPAYITRGNQVAQHYQAYGKRLAAYHASLTVALNENAPELLAYLQSPQPVLNGGQVLPAIIADAAADKFSLTGTAYSWPWTDQLIDLELQQIARAEAGLNRAKSGPAKSRELLQSLALDYRTRRRQHANIDEHIQYNRLWQAAIAANRSRYADETALYAGVIERQSIAERLRRMRVAFEKSAMTYNAPLRFAELSGSLQSRAEWLTHRIDAALDKVDTPDFVKIEKMASAWIIRVPLFTDIEDRQFLHVVKQSIENSWRAKQGGTTYRVELDVAYISADVLYPNGGEPLTAPALDLSAHLTRFPTGGAILTTGASTTHVLDRAIILGPHALTPRVLAHEFGHILGFRDRYIRGYKDLGEDGFVVLEVVADPQDIMSATSAGTVLPAHFQRILNRRPDALKLVPASQPVNPTETRSQT